MPKPYFRSNYAEVKTQFEPPFDNCVCIPLTRGYHALIDAEDFHIADDMWHATNDYNCVYARRFTRRAKAITMHSIIFKVEKGKVIDHINNNGLDNRKRNLRSATTAQNSANTGIYKNNKSGYRGVSFLKETKNWRATIRNNGRIENLGYFSDPKEAAHAYDAAAIAYRGEFARANFPALDAALKGS